MKETKELKEKEKKANKKNKENNRGKEKPTIGDIIFRIVILLSIFFIVVISYVFYLRGIKSRASLNTYSTTQEVKKITENY